MVRNAYAALLLPPGRSEGAKIELSARVIGPWIEIFIQDNGPGMEEDHLREVREFLPGQTTKNGIGTGFGLPIARRHDQAHGEAPSPRGEWPESPRILARLVLVEDQ